MTRLPLLLVGLVGACALVACSTSAPAASGGDTVKATTLTGSITFNDSNLDKLRDQIKQALQGKDLSAVREAMVVNVAADYWHAGQVGFEQAAKELGVKGDFQAPANGQLTQQLSILETLRSQGTTGFTVSPIDPSALVTPVNSAIDAGIDVVAIDSPLPGSKVGLYLGTPNEQAGQKAGEAMKQVLGGKGDVVVLVGSLTASNATERIAGFKKALEGTDIKVTQVLNDNFDAAKALSNAETAFQTDPNVRGIYGVYSYDGPSAGQAVKGAGKTGQVAIVSDDSDPQTLDFVKQGVIQATVLQQPYQQGYLGGYLLAAYKVLGKDATDKLVKPFLEADGSTLSSGVGLVTQQNLDAYKGMLTKLGIG